jgi:mono/diheme cytochrome c family protein
MRAYLVLSGGLLVAASIADAAPAFAQHMTIGAIEFRMSCAVCHGEDARGDGPLAHLLTIKPSDLTQLSKRNKGQFPFERMVETIDGRTQVSGHGTREMPVWGTRYEADVGRQYGPYGSETVVRTRILELVHYLETIQQK